MAASRAIVAGLFAVAIAFSWAANAHAGRSCEEITLPAEEVDRAMQLAWKTRDTLETAGA
jgi:hypothetical protein